MTTSHAVHWHEGMFMRPHHFQASHRYLLEQIRRSHQWDVHYSWGVRLLEIDLDALRNHRLDILRLEARFRDGTIVKFPQDGELPRPSLKAAMDRQNSVTVYLGVPALYLGHANASLSGSADARFRVESEEFVDENTGFNPQSISVRQLNVQLLLGDQDLPGYEVLPIARIVKSASAEAAPQLDEAFIPPLLSCDGWQPFHAGVLQAVADRIRKKMDFLANRITTKNITFDAQAQGDALVLNQLRKLNEAAVALHVLLNAQGVHPLSAYLELSRIVGQLSIFGAARRLHDLPHYDHDELYKCFSELKLHLNELLDIVDEPEYQERAFIGAGLRMQVALEPAWLETAWQLFIGVRTSLDEEACVRLLTRPKELDMKIGSSEHVDALFLGGKGGLRFDVLKRSPRALPADSGWVFLQIKRDPKDQEWQHVLKTFNLAVRINESFIGSSIQNQRKLSIKTPSTSTTLEFMLFAVPQDKV